MRDRSLRQAADRLGISQPALSQQIVSLESAMGRRLFVRTSRGIEPTEAARILQPRAEGIVRALDETVREVRDGADGYGGILRIAAAPTAAAGIVARAFRLFHAERPGVLLSLREAYPDAALGLLEDGSVDLAIVRGPLQRSGVRVATLFEEPLVLIVGRASRSGVRLAGLGGPVPIGALAGESFVMIGVDARTTLHALVIAACADAGFVPRIACEGAELLTLGRLVEDGVGIALVPRSTAGLLRRRAILELPLEPPHPSSSLVIAERSDRPLPAAAAAFRSLLIQGAQADH